MKRVIAALLLCTSVVGAQDGGSQGDAFYAAIRANDLAGLAALLKAGADPNAAEPRGGMTPLMHAAVSRLAGGDDAAPRQWRVRQRGQQRRR